MPQTPPLFVPEAAPSGAVAPPSGPRTEPMPQPPRVWSVNLEGTTAETAPRCSTEDLLLLIATGKVVGDTFVWAEGMPEWLPIDELPELAVHLPKH